MVYFEFLFTLNLLIVSALAKLFDIRPSVMATIKPEAFN
jgi:hypothetical protein